MKNRFGKFAFLLLFALPFSAFSQQTKAGKTDLLITETTLGEGIGFQYQARVDGRIAEIFKNSGVAFPNYNAFIVLPNLEKISEKSVDSIEKGTENAYRLRFLVKNAFSDQTISTHETTLIGLGRSPDEALVRALVAIRMTNGDLRRTANSLKQDIRDYFLTKSDSIVLSIQKKLATKKYDEAFTLANSVPDDAPKFEEIKKMKETAFAGYQESLCATLWSRFDASFTENQAAAMDILTTIDPANACAADVKMKLPTIQSQLSEPVRNANAWFFDAFLKENDPKMTRPRTEAAIAKLTLVGDGAKYRFVKTGI
jgi:hypothetical protein